MSADERPYEAPRVEELPSEEGPAVTAAGDSIQRAVEWRPTDEEANDER
jgi:hypothetical protein